MWIFIKSENFELNWKFNCILTITLKVDFRFDAKDFYIETMFWWEEDDLLMVYL